MRGAPHSAFSRLIRRINTLTSSGTGGRLRRRVLGLFPRFFHLSVDNLVKNLGKDPVKRNCCSQIVPFSVVIASTA